MGLAPAPAISEAVAEHLASTEGERGLYAEIVAADPRLCSAVEALLREHADFRQALRYPLTAETTAALTTLFDRHRQRGNDLMYEAYVVDLGGEH